MLSQWAKEAVPRTFLRHLPGFAGAFAALLTWVCRPALGPGVRAAKPVDLATWIVLAFLAGVVVAYTARGVERLVRRARAGLLRRDEVLVPAAFFTFAALVFGAWLAGQWPGMFTTDSITATEEGISGRFTEWGAWIYSWYWYASRRFSPSPALLGGVQCLVAALGVTWVAAGTWWRTRHKVVVTVCLVACIVAPPNGVQNIFYSRDWLFSWMQVGLALTVVLPLRLGRSREPSLLTLVTTVVCLAAIGTLRTEGVFLVFLYPFVMAATRVWRVSTALVCLVLAGGLYRYETTSFKEYISVVKPESRKYEATAFLNLAGAIPSTAYYSRFGVDDDRVELSKVVDFQKLRELWGPYELPVLWSGGVRNDFTDEEFKAFSRRTMIIALDNPALTIGFRSMTFFSTLGFSAYSLRFYDYVPRDPHPSGHSARLAALGIRKEPLIEPLLAVTDAIATKSSDWTSFPAPSMLVWNSTPGLLLCLWAFFRGRSAPRTVGAAFLILSRVPIVWLFSPAAQFKYLYSLFLYGFFVIPVWLAERGPDFDMWVALRQSLPFAKRPPRAVTL
jgi:hypothetical protein